MIYQSLAYQWLKPDFNLLLRATLFSTIFKVFEDRLGNIMCNTGACSNRICNNKSNTCGLRRSFERMSGHTWDAGYTSRVSKLVIRSSLTSMANRSFPFRRIERAGGLRQAIHDDRDDLVAPPHVPVPDLSSSEAAPGTPSRGPSLADGEIFFPPASITGFSLPPPV
jgi:hypothetical protein